MDKTTLNISMGTIYRIFFIVLILIFLYYIADILLLIFTSFIIVSAISPLVDRLEAKKIPRPVSTIFIYLCALLGFGYLLTLFIPSVISQGKSLLENLPRYWDELAANPWVKSFFSLGIDAELSSDKLLEMFRGNFSFSQGFFSKASSLLVHFIYSLVIFSLSFYMTIQKNALKKGVGMLVPKKNRDYAISLASRIQEKMGHWLQGQLFLNVIVGVLVYLALFLLGVPYALILALIAGLLEFIPNIGPILASIFAAAVALTVSPFIAILVIVIFIIIQQLENHFIVPLVMKKAVGLNPVIIIAVILVGLKLGGPLGALLAVPITTAFSIFLKDFLDKEEEKN